MADDKLTLHSLMQMPVMALAQRCLMQQTLLDDHDTFNARRTEGMEARLAGKIEDDNPYPEEPGGGWARGWNEMDNLIRRKEAEAKLAETLLMLRNLADTARPDQGQPAEGADTPLREKIESWLTSGGREVIEAAIRQAEETSSAILREYRPDPTTLRQPMTI